MGSGPWRGRGGGPHELRFKRYSDQCSDQSPPGVSQKLFISHRHQDQNILAKNGALRNLWSCVGFENTFSTPETKMVYLTHP